MDRINLPHDIDSECSVLGALLMDANSFWRVCDILEPGDFYAEQNRIIYSTIQDMGLNGSGVGDLVLTTQRLRSNNELERVGGATYLNSLIDILPDVANIEHYAGVISDLAQKRELIRLTQTVLADTASGGTVENARDKLLTGLSGLKSAMAMEIHDMADLAREVAEHSIQVHLGEEKAFGFLTGISRLDDFLHGLKGGCLYYVAARPGMGKSTLVDQIAVHVGQNSGNPVLLAITEMSPRQRSARYVSAKTGVSLPQIHSGMLSKKAEFDFAHLVGDARLSNVLVTSANGNTAMQLRLMIKRFILRYGKPSLVVVDYIQQLRAAVPGMNMNDRTAEKSTQLKEMAIELDIPVIACSQLSRDNEREKRAPRLSDLRESGELEQDAYVVIFLHRSDLDKNLVAVNVAKHRDGPTGGFELMFYPNRMRFGSTEMR